MSFLTNLDLPVTIIGSVIGIILGITTYYDQKKINLDQIRIEKRFFWEFFIPQYLDGYYTFGDKDIALKEGRRKFKYNTNFVTLSLEYGIPTEENKLVHRLTVLLNRIGQAAFIGDLSLNYIFPNASKMILEDWERAKALIERITENDESKGIIGYTRRFFQWIACACCMYLITEHVSTLKLAKNCIKQYAKDDGDFERLMLDNCNGMKNEIDILQNDLQKSNEKLSSNVTKLCIKKLQTKFCKRVKELTQEQT